MDTVTEYRMAIAIAREGGIGIIHKNMSIGAQAEQVDMVKRSENGVITNPFWLAPGHTLAEADELMAKYRISGVPICDNGKLIGIITNRDMKFEVDMSQLIDNVMTKENLVTAKEGITLEEAKEILRKHKIEKLPLVDDEFRLKGLITIKDIEKATVYPNSARDAKGRLRGRRHRRDQRRAGPCGRPGGGRRRRAVPGLRPRPQPQYPGVRQAHQGPVPRRAAHRRQRGHRRGHQGPHRGRRRLREGGASAPAPSAPPAWWPVSALPQITAVYDAACVADKYGIPIIADGGVKYFRRHRQGHCRRRQRGHAGPPCWPAARSPPGDTEVYQGRQFKVYRGMGSLGAMAKGSRDRYFQQNNKKLVPEGVEGRVPYKGSTSDTI